MITPEKNIESYLVTIAEETDSAYFDEYEVLKELKHYLPTQTPLKDFIHHNSLHAFQEYKFFHALFRASTIFGFQTSLQLAEFRELYQTGRIRQDILERTIIERKGKHQLDNWLKKLIEGNYNTIVNPRIGQLRAEWKKQYQIGLDDMVQPTLFRILSAYLDQGISIWKFPVRTEGFLASIKALEKNSFTSFFTSKKARQLLHDPGTTISSLLKLIVGEEMYFEQYLFDQQFTHRGWSGIVCAVEAEPHTLLDPKSISLKELILFELLLEIDSLQSSLGDNWKPLCKNYKEKPADLLAEIDDKEVHEVFTIWQLAFEWSYYDEVIGGLKSVSPNNKPVKSTRSFQALFCIDERECSFRRYVEQTDQDCVTFGTPGFFGVEFYFQAEHAKFYDKLCPAPVTPTYLIKEVQVKEHRKRELLYNQQTHHYFGGFISTIALGYLAVVRMMQNLFAPKMSPAISNAFTHMTKDGKLVIENRDVDDKENGLQLGFTVTEMTNRVEGLLRGIGLVEQYAPIVYVIAHGSSSANNPHHGAHDCGACSGRPGSVNARVFAFMANHPGVRSALKDRGLIIPDETIFIGALHDTAGDRIEFYDDEELDFVHNEMHERNKQSFEGALDLNARERSRRFASINTNASLANVRKAIHDRSVSLFEPRPELGHGTNTLCIIGRRDMTSGLFLDRRAFLNSYDYRTDPDGKRLTGLMRPIGPVCGGINLEYYFSRVDNYKLGAGTKLPHNVMGLIGVANSSDGDLRPGLPVQMIEVHDPVRLLVIVEHKPEIVLQTISSAPDMYEWYANEWVHIMVKDPETSEYYYFKDGQFVPYACLTSSVDRITDMKQLVEKAREMETNYIVDATKENLPVYNI